MVRGRPVIRERFRHMIARAVGVTIAMYGTVGLAAAQGGGCPLPQQAATGLSQTSQQLVGIIIIAGIVAAGIAEGISRIKRDPNEEADWKQYRNGAAMSVVTVPLLMWFIVNTAGNFGIGIAQCVDLVPFF